jgi:hypothetical protein
MTSRVADIAERLSSLVAIIETPADAVTFSGLRSALENFQECVRYLNTRRSTGAVLNLEGEADVQDALFLMLRLWVTDVVYENPTDKIANRYGIKDFLIPQARTVVEAKFIRDKQHGRHILAELSLDIETYRRHPLCDHIIFFVYDPDSMIPDREQLRGAVEVARAYDGRPLDCSLIVKP